MTKDDIKSLLFELHHSTFRNWKQIKNSKVCGCFNCCRVFRPQDIKEWCDNDGRGDPTAICPNCGLDSVIGDDCGVQITTSFLELMNLQFMGGGIDNVRVNLSLDYEEM